MFNNQKVRGGLEKALEKRPGIDRVQEIVERIESKLVAKGKREIQSKVIGGLVLTELKRIDKVAYLRFASVYRDFKDPTDFAKELQGLN